jgi:bifunctional DNA-binding transcriptional regulator/antitoxin component of YhaV-PrlF toxin-antitoxin module
MTMVKPPAGMAAMALPSSNSVSLGKMPSLTKYAVSMDAIQRYLVSTSGQMSIPAAVRHRWHLNQGGPVDVIDLGFGVLTVPAGEAKRLLGDLLSHEDHAAFVRSLANDPDLATT